MVTKQLQEQPIKQKKELFVEINVWFPLTNSHLTLSAAEADGSFINFAGIWRNELIYWLKWTPVLNLSFSLVPKSQLKFANVNAGGRNQSQQWLFWPNLIPILWVDFDIF